MGHDATKSNIYGNEPQTMTKVEATTDLKQRFEILTSSFDDLKKKAVIFGGSQLS